MKVTDTDMGKEEQNLNIDHDQQFDVQDAAELEAEAEALMAFFRVQTKDREQQRLTAEQKNRIKSNVLKSIKDSSAEQSVVAFKPDRKSKRSRPGRLLRTVVAPIAAVFIFSLGLFLFSKYMGTRQDLTVTKGEEGVVADADIDDQTNSDNVDSGDNQVEAIMEEPEQPAMADEDMDSEVSPLEEREVAKDMAGKDVADYQSVGGIIDSADSRYIMLNRLMASLESSGWTRVSPEDLQKEDDLKALLTGEASELILYQTEREEQQIFVGYYGLFTDSVADQADVLKETEALFTRSGYSVVSVDNQEDILEFLSSTDAQLSEMANAAVNAVLEEEITDIDAKLQLWLFIK